MIYFLAFTRLKFYFFNEKILQFANFASNRIGHIFFLIYLLVFPQCGLQDSRFLEFGLGVILFYFFFSGGLGATATGLFATSKLSPVEKVCAMFSASHSSPFLPSNFAPIGAWSIPLASGCGSFNWSPTGHLIGLWFVVRIANVSITSSKKYIYICPAEESSEGETWSYFRDFHTLSISV